MDVATFQRTFPEFQQTDAGLIQAKLNEAALEIGRAAFGSFAASGSPITLADKAQAYLAAHLLTQNPLGQATRSAPDKGESVYLVEYKRLLGIAALPGSVIVSGGPSAFRRRPWF